MNSLATDHLRRLETLLATARADYDTLAYIMLEGMGEVTVYSRTRQVSLPVGGEDAGHIQALLGEAALHRITALEQEIAQTHGLIAQEAAEDAREQAELASCRRQARAVGTAPTRCKRGAQSAA